MTTPDSQPGRREIRLEVQVSGTPEQVWQAIATGPGITSWYVPHVVQERAGGAATASFGPEPEMQIPGRVAAWEPPHRIVFDGGEGVPGLAFEWLVEARDGGTCVVRLVNSGFGDGNPWDDQYDEMTEGWRVFLRNLQLHLAHFAGQVATPVLPMTAWPGTPDEVWAALTTALGMPPAPAVGESVRTAAPGAPQLSGEVVDTGPHKIVLLLEKPCPGTAFVMAEGREAVGVSLWAYLYGPDAPAVAAELDPRWRAWLQAQVTTT